MFDWIVSILNKKGRRKLQQAVSPKTEVTDGHYTVIVCFYGVYDKWEADADPGDAKGSVILKGPNFKVKIGSLLSPTNLKGPDIGTKSLLNKIEMALLNKNISVPREKWEPLVKEAVSDYQYLMQRS